MGARVDERPDGLAITGVGALHGARVASGGDHRMAMALAVAGLVARGETLIDDTACVATSYPHFVETVNALAGGDVITVEA
jgi:3-phosphoshikimate 1-carboxyvinyltransferase